MNMLLGFISPQSGEIRINDMPLTPEHFEAWRKQLAWMPQRAHLFHGSVRDNIALGQPEASDQAIKAAAEAAQIAEYIETLPALYETAVGERGAGLSGGQIQRIALARAFLKDAPVMLLDEPTAHLDQESEQRIQKSLEQLARNRTVISIAHRLQTIEQADRIVLLEAGEILAIGSHDSLLAEQPRYAEMVSRLKQGDL
jgi:ATP-binding cassette subfamily C protein CydD